MTESRCIANTTKPGTEADSAIEELAERLHWALNKYDPSDAPEWAEMDDKGKDVCRAVIRSLLCRGDLLLIALRD